MAAEVGNIIISYLLVVVVKATEAEIIAEVVLVVDDVVAVFICRI